MRKYFTGIILILLLGALFTGCSTINKLDEVELTGTAIALDLKAPPAPTVEVDYYSDYYGENNQVMTMLQIGTNLIKAGEAQEAEQKLIKALEGMYLPEFVAELTYDRLTRTLDAYPTANVQNADVVLEIDIEEYGLETWSSNGQIEMLIKMEVRLWHVHNKEIVWQRRVDASKEVTPGLFGFDGIIGNAVTIAGLDNLTEEELREGFKKLTIEIMKETISYLQEDIREARRRK